MLENLSWLGHASFKISGEKTIYFDPWQLPEDSEPADMILISHGHGDHCSPGDVKKIQTDDTTIIAPAASASGLSGNVKGMEAGETVTVGDVTIEAVPAYNISKGFHPKSSGGLGYVVTVGGERIYHSGDTDFIPEMKEIQADVVLLPVGGTYTMTAEEAVEAARAISPKVAVPMHYGTIVGSREDAEKFKELCDVEVRIL